MDRAARIVAEEGKDMTQEDILRMAREAGIIWWSSDQTPLLVRFAALVAAAERERAIGIAKGMQEELQAKFEQTYMEGVIAGAAAEREACAKVCDAAAKKMDDEGEGPTGYIAWVTDCATAIRARGNK